MRNMIDSLKRNEQRTYASMGTAYRAASFTVLVKIMMEFCANVFARYTSIVSFSFNGMRR